jgi:nesprin-1
MSALSSASVELEQVRSAKDSIAKWIEESLKKLSEIQLRPAKLRQDTATLELNQLTELCSGVADRVLQLSELEHQESGLVQGKYLPNLESQLSNLDSEISSVISTRGDIQAQINNYRVSLASVSKWLEEIAKSLDPLEKGGGLTLAQKKELATSKELELEGGSHRVESVKKAADRISSSLSNVDAQLVEEQLKSVDRRYNEMVKRVGRKRKILENTLQSYQDFQLDSDQVKQEIEAKIEEGAAKRGFELGPMESVHLALKSALKDVEGKQTILDTLDRRLTTLQPELEEGEIISAEQSLNNVIKLHSTACDLLRKRLRELAEELGNF